MGPQWIPPRNHNIEQLQYAINLNWKNIDFINVTHRVQGIYGVPLLHNSQNNFSSPPLIKLLSLLTEFFEEF